MGRRNLRADAGLSLGNDGIEEADGVHSFVQKLGGEFLGQDGIQIGRASCRERV